MTQLNTTRLLFNGVFFNRSLYKYKFALVNDVIKVGLKKSIQESLGLPGPPKKPATSFIKYFLDIQQQLKTQYPESPQTDILKRASVSWKTLDSERKIKYELQYKEQLAEYSRQISSYQSDLSDEDKKALKHAKDEQTKKRRVRKLKQEAIKFDKPKRPISAFLLFMKTKLLANEASNASFSRFVQEWKQLDDVGKEKYKKENESLIKQYSIDLANWEAKMIQEGRTHLVNKSSLPKVKKIRKVRSKKPPKKVKRKSAKQRKPNKEKSSKKSKESILKSSEALDEKLKSSSNTEDNA